MQNFSDLVLTKFGRCSSRKTFLNLVFNGGGKINVRFSTENWPYHNRAVAQPCVNGDRLSQWRMAKFDLAQVQNPSTDRHKIWNRWLRPRDDPLCKISCKSGHWGLLDKWVKYNENFSSIYILFCWPTYRTDRPADFHAQRLEQRGLTQGSNLFGNRSSKLIPNPWKIPQSRKLGPKNGLWNFRPRTLLYKNFTYKRPLIVIVGP